MDRIKLLKIALIVIVGLVVMACLSRMSGCKEPVNPVGVDTIQNVAHQIEKDSTYHKHIEDSLRSKLGIVQSGLISLNAKYQNLLHSGVLERAPEVCDSVKAFANEVIKECAEKDSIYQREVAIVQAQKQNADSLNDNLRKSAYQLEDTGLQMAGELGEAKVEIVDLKGKVGKRNKILYGASFGVVAAILAKLFLVK